MENRRPARAYDQGMVVAEQPQASTLKRATASPGWRSVAVALALSAVGATGCVRTPVVPGEERLETFASDA